MHANTIPRQVLLKQLDEATKSRDCYFAQYRKVRDMADERTTPQGREATMGHAMRLKAQGLVWDREVCRLTAELQAGPAHLSLVSAEQCAAVGDTHNFPCGGAGMTARRLTPAEIGAIVDRKRAEAALAAGACLSRCSGPCDQGHAPRVFPTGTSAVSGIEHEPPSNTSAPRERMGRLSPVERALLSRRPMHVWVVMVAFALLCVYQ